jgi:hypothetical protein
MEPQTFTKKVAPYTTDPRTLLGGHKVTLTLDKDRPVELIPKYSEHDEESDNLENENENENDNEKSDKIGKSVKFKESVKF